MAHPAPTDPAGLADYPGEIRIDRRIILFISACFSGNQ
jgi:hypothetical protein